jgi:hypothetical protein
MDQIEIKPRKIFSYSFIYFLVVINLYGTYNVKYNLFIQDRVRYRCNTRSTISNQIPSRICL